MKLTDQEQVILRAIDQVGRNGLASIASVIKAVGYPKATVKKALISLSNKGAVSLHRHDYPASLKPEQRKLLVRIGRDYFSAVSMRKRNPAKKSKSKTPAKAKPILRVVVVETGHDDLLIGYSNGREVIRTYNSNTLHRFVRDNGYQIRWANPSKGKTALKRTGRALKGFARGALSAGSEILGAGAMALNPVRRKVRNKYIDLVIKGQAKKTPQGWRVGKKTFAQGRGTVNVSSGYYLDRHTGMVYAKRERNMAKRKQHSTSPRARRRPAKKKKRRNVSEGFYDASGVFHPIRSSSDYSPTTAGETGRRPRRSKAKKKVAAKRKASQTARRRSGIRARKATTRIASRGLAKRTSTGKRLKRARKNPSAESIRRKFAGRVSGERDVFVPSSTPKGKLAKLGNLVLIQTEQGVIKPVRGSAVLLADTRGKLHIGTTSKSDLFSGPRQSFGEVKRIEYDSSKPHLGYPSPIIWHHKLGEESGHRPTLYADGQGGLVFRGGRYRLTRRGIEN